MIGSARPIAARPVLGVEHSSGGLARLVVGAWIRRARRAGARVTALRRVPAAVRRWQDPFDHLDAGPVVAGSSGNTSDRFPAAACLSAVAGLDRRSGPHEPAQRAAPAAPFQSRDQPAHPGQSRHPGLAADSPCMVDIAKFESAMERTGAAARQTEQRLAALQSAACVYDGDLLPECDDEWLIEDRERLRDRYVWVLRELAEELAFRNDYAEATAAGLELVRRDPLNELNHRLLISLRASAGDRAGAARAYHQCVTILEQELGVEPSVETRNIYATVMDTASSGDLGDRHATRDSPPPRFTGAALVGREQQLAALTRCWQVTKTGQARLVLVSGEAGVGKTGSWSNSLPGARAMESPSPAPGRTPPKASSATASSSVGCAAPPWRTRCDARPGRIGSSLPGSCPSLSTPPNRHRRHSARATGCGSSMPIVRTLTAGRPARAVLADDAMVRSSQPAPDPLPRPHCHRTPGPDRGDRPTRGPRLGAPARRCRRPSPDP